MKYIIGGRQTGKTEKLVAWMQETPESVMITHSMSEARRIAEQYGIDKQRVVSYVEARNIRGLNPATKFCADNIDIILCNLLGVYADVSTATGEVEK